MLPWLPAHSMCWCVVAPLTRCPYLCSDVAWGKHQKMCTAAKPFRPAGTGLGKESLSTKLEPGLIGGTQHAKMVLPEAGERLRDRVGPAAATYEVSWPSPSTTCHHRLSHRAHAGKCPWRHLAAALPPPQIRWAGLFSLCLTPQAAGHACAGKCCVPAAAIYEVSPPRVWREPHNR